MPRPIALTDPAAREPEVVGYKAALLAEAGAEGLPSLPGSVLPLEASAPAIAAGAEALVRSGPPAAYLAASAIGPDRDALESLGHVATAAAVRSSTVLDADGRWSGAFTTYLDVGAADLDTAVRGCWASVFSRDALERCEATGLDVDAMRVGVLVQPWVPFDLGGTARAFGDGRVVVTGAPGGPHGVVQGAPGEAASIEVGPYGVGPGASDHDQLAAVANDVAALARRAADATGIGVIEWGSTDREVALLQIGPVPADVAVWGPGRAPRQEGPVPAAVTRVAALAPWFPGPLGEELVVPWALGMTAPIWPEADAVADAAQALADARAIAGRLTAQVWDLPADAAFREAGSAVHLLREGSYEAAADAIGPTRSPDPADAVRVVGLVRGIGAALASREVLPAADLVWQLSADGLGAAIEGRPPVLRRGPDRWEPLVVDVAMAAGSVVRGRPVAGGVGAGRLHRLDALRSIGRPGPRAVLLAPLPLPQLAPLLWHCAGLVTSGGSEGAHLFEVARSLGVPAVIQVDGAALGPEGTVVAVDGASGEVASLNASAEVDEGSR